MSDRHARQDDITPRTISAHLGTRRGYTRHLAKLVTP
jgi:hypothetical protein